MSTTRKSPTLPKPTKATEIRTVRQADQAVRRVAKDAFALASYGVPCEDVLQYVVEAYQKAQDLME